MTDPTLHDQEYIRAKMCQGKKPYPNKRQARQSIERMQAKYPDTDPTLAVYECPWCHQYHTGRSRYRTADQDTEKGTRRGR